MLTLVTAPTVEPLDITDTKSWNGVTISNDDTKFTLLVSGLRNHGEGMTRRSWAPQTWCLSLDRFPRENGSVIELPRGPVTSITSFTYVDTNGVTQDLVDGDYDKDFDSIVARVRPLAGGSWPDTKNTLNAVKITYEAGWTTANIPKPILQWLQMKVSTYYEQPNDIAIGMYVASLSRDFCDALLDQFTVESSP